MKTSFIYFDLGKVMFEFDHWIGCRKIASSTGLAPETVHRAIFVSGLEERFETGEFSSATFCQHVRCELDVGISDLEILDAISDVFTPRIDIFPVVGQLTAVGFPMGVLSNTCAAHWRFLMRRYTLLRECFATAVLSYEVGAMKPASKIYQQAYQSAQSVITCDRGEIFFVDDRQENVTGAIEYGFDAALFTNTGDLLAELVKRGVRINL